MQKTVFRTLILTLVFFVSTSFAHAQFFSVLGDNFTNAEPEPTPVAVQEPSPIINPTPDPIVSDPDLTVGNTTVIGAREVGSTLTLSAIMRNIGLGTAEYGPGFLVYSQVYDRTRRQNIGEGLRGYGSPLLPLRSRALQDTWTPTQSGDYQARFCADIPPNPSGNVSESNEGNNCGAWTTFSINAAGQPDLSVDAPSISGTRQAGQTLTFSSRMRNIGNATASRSGNFATTFQIYRSSTQIVGRGTSTNGQALSAGASRTITDTWTAEAGSYVARFCADIPPASPGNIPESNESNNCSGWTSFTVSSPVASGAPDLTVGATSISGTPTLNQALNFSATMSNIGNATASHSGGFRNYFQVWDFTRSQNNGTTITNKGSNLNVGQSRTLTGSFTPTQAGNYQARFCADIPPNPSGNVSESNENNNCGAWQSFTVADVPAGSGAGDRLTGHAWSSNIGWVSFYGPGYEVNIDANSGNLSGYAWSSNIGWISFNGNHTNGCPSGSCQANYNNSNGNVTGWAKALAGGGSNSGNWDGWIYLGQSSRVGVNVDANCNWNGRAWGGGSSLSTGVIGWLSFNGPGYGVTGTGAGCPIAEPAPVASLALNPEIILEGASSQLTWGSTGATSCVGTNFSTGGSTSGTVNVSPSTTTGYSVRCTGPGGVDTASAQLTVDSVTQTATASLSVSPASIQTGNSATLSWSSANADSCTGTNFSTGGSTIGSMSVSPSSTVTYGLECSNTGNSDTDSATLTVTQGPGGGGGGSRPTADINASPRSILIGESSTISWTSTNADSCSGTGFSTSGSTSGNAAVSPTSDATYQVQCTNSQGSTNDFVDVEVLQPNITITVDGESDSIRVAKDAVVDVVWHAEDTDSCDVVGPGVLVNNATDDPFDGSASVTISERSVYTIECDASTETYTESVTVNIPPDFEEF